MKTIIFDFDGTLADCKKLHQTAFRKAVSHFDPAFKYSDETIEALPTYKKVEILKDLGANISLKELNDLKQKLTMQSLPDYVIFNKDVYTELSRLKMRYNLCLASNASCKFIHSSLTIMKIKDLFIKINTSTNYPAKPDTSMFLDCMAFTNSVPNNTIIFEDSPVGILSAKKTGATVIEVLNVAETISYMKNL